jgi:glycosyltransferase involved in cell wall biosynthesis
LKQKLDKFKKGSAKPRVIIVSAVIPAIHCGGGCLALHRHFVERDDFTISVCSRIAGESSCPEQFSIRSNRIWARVKRTALGRLLVNAEYVFASKWLPEGLFRYAKKWKPDLVFSVADDYHAPIARRLAQKLGIPFVINFQDLFACSNFQNGKRRPYRWVVPHLLQRYRDLHQNADGVFYTGKGMRDWFGAEARGEVLYPVGAAVSVQPPVAIAPLGRLVLTYTGNCLGPYGDMLLRLAREMDGHPQISLEIYTMGNDWPAREVEYFTRCGILRGFLPFDQLRNELSRADAFLTAMSFHPADRVFVETSFTTKWLDYAPCGKPIFVWAPNYSSAAHFVRETGAGLVVDDPEPKAVVSVIQTVATNPTRWGEAGSAAARVAAKELNAEYLHTVLRQHLMKLVVENQLANRNGERTA